MAPKKIVITMAVETMLSWKIFSQPGSLRSSTLSSFTQVRCDLVSEPGGELLLMADGETAAVGDLLRRLAYIMLEVIPQ